MPTLHAMPTTPLAVPIGVPVSSPRTVSITRLRHHLDQAGAGQLRVIRPQ